VCVCMCVRAHKCLPHAPRPASLAQTCCTPLASPPSGLHPHPRAPPCSVAQGRRSGGKGARGMQDGVSRSPSSTDTAGGQPGRARQSEAERGRARQSEAEPGTAELTPGWGEGHGQHTRSNTAQDWGCCPENGRLGGATIFAVPVAVFTCFRAWVIPDSSLPRPASTDVPGTTRSHKKTQPQAASSAPPPSHNATWPGLANTHTRLIRQTTNTTEPPTSTAHIRILSVLSSQHGLTRFHALAAKNENKILTATAHTHALADRIYFGSTHLAPPCIPMMTSSSLPLKCHHPQAPSHPPW
jgi:hypothetical protein